MSRLTYKILAAQRTARRAYTPPEPTWPAPKPFEKLNYDLRLFAARMTEVLAPAIAELNQKAAAFNDAYRQAVKQNPPFWAAPPRGARR